MAMPPMAMVPARKCQIGTCSTATLVTGQAKPQANVT
jgi:hypothetical protein